MCSPHFIRLFIHPFLASTALMICQPLHAMHNVELIEEKGKSNPGSNLATEALAKLDPESDARQKPNFIFSKTASYLIVSTNCTFFKIHLIFLTSNSTL